MRPRRRCYRTAEASTAKAPGRQETGSDRREPVAPSLAIPQTKTAYVLERTPFEVNSFEHYCGLLGLLSHRPRWSHGGGRGAVGLRADRFPRGIRAGGVRVRIAVSA